ncbi:4-hydroxy-tetrahydrodipicolinate reductase [Simkania negevensis]|uniref:4-hydroxy-tetrahydrodipicolinate reductase n=1 Tax=Simkania negevensis (strain ATCC VR-1471 / DSM 27360 / Z) TaxID=331113 RepID=F8L809_SIMNZ|nr:dihydrodipicolinate reductase C-terminal domain-containing protein [Simkania negevensis]MCB1066835.1 4-hydroxy-tetrahydrodipicolinate reductase [Simkania sp.]MCB1074016.1 4-hydroxy-tetrahydrodipicolinate reductase [Simkania sp.]MCP5490450.1 4-hydroxy-tetrahydrodipicolinate reductase [Chlamydiales bacterium]CCB88911.1 dihydrodipicolinate reductase [Simkania negevensis Z]
MKIGLIGFGKMGGATQIAAIERGHEVGAIVSSKGDDFSSLEDVDICIDFTAPDAVLENLRKIAPLKKNIVIGTTGWDSQYDEVCKMAEEASLGLLYAPNFSFGVYLFRKLVFYAQELTKPFDFDVAGIEMHHNQKKDAPSGTARSLKGVPFTSLRIGDIIGTHQVLFNSGDDTIELTHRASTRMGFARGAVQAAEWLQGKKGVFSFDDFMKDMLCDSKELLPRSSPHLKIKPSMSKG